MTVDLPRAGAPADLSTATRAVDRMDAKKLAKAKADLRKHLMRLSQQFTGLEWNEEDDQVLDLVTTWVEKQASRAGHNG